MDPQGLRRAVAVHPADLQDRDGARLVLARLPNRFPRLQRLWADAGYAGPKLGDWVRQATPWDLEIVCRPEPGAGFRVLPQCWVVERTFAWLGRHRRLSKDYEVLPDTTEAWIHAAMTGLMLRRLAQTQPFKHPLRETTSVSDKNMARCPAAEPQEACACTPHRPEGKPGDAQRK